LAYIIVGRLAVIRVQKLRQEVFPPRVLKKKFAEFDSDDDGQLDFKEFHELLLSLGVEITYQGSEMIFVSLDRDMQGGLDYDEFSKFWSTDPLTMIPV
jgi:Ca2+-binding EF-hand superfamily protein